MTILTLALSRVPTVCCEAAPDVAALPADIGVHRVAPHTQVPRAGVPTVVVRRGDVLIIGHARRLGIPTLTLDPSLSRINVTSVAYCRHIAVRGVWSICIKLTLYRPHFYILYQYYKERTKIILNKCQVARVKAETAQSRDLGPCSRPRFLYTCD